jgi:hypothetical protein
MVLVFGALAVIVFSWIAVPTARTFLRWGWSPTRSTDTMVFWAQHRSSHG